MSPVNSNVIYLTDRRKEDALKRENARLKQELADIHNSQMRRRKSDQMPTKHSAHDLMIIMALAALIAIASAVYFAA